MNKLTAEKCRYRVEQLKSWGSINNRGITAREEDYIQALEIALPILEQRERGDSWIEWGGGDIPVSEHTPLLVRYRGEFQDEKCIAGNMIWNHSGEEDDIIAYRIIPEQPTNQNGEQ